MYWYRYGDADGASITVTENWISGDTSGSNTYTSVAAVTFDGENGEEEMHVFFAMGWFDVGSWAWAHYIAEWATKGIFAVSENKCHTWCIHVRWLISFGGGYSSTCRLTVSE